MAPLQYDFVMDGPRARDLPAHGCALDLHPYAFGAGRCVRKTPARTLVVQVARTTPASGCWSARPSPAA
ncbi:hypothetical protein GCM10010269_13820 [Streptomyces humidus]|uniref:Uncharacterized protein n=1 Tax=Streptomyces humidus TaxID=52259 RepID=A0A918FS82_9ACTN|nr:hypothetical protein GCM10010269_13820 [Streptomyces humidus]